MQGEVAIMTATPESLFKIITLLKVPSCFALLNFSKIYQRYILFGQYFATSQISGIYFYQYVQYTPKTIKQ